MDMKTLYQLESFPEPKDRVNYGHDIMQEKRNRSIRQLVQQAGLVQLLGNHIDSEKCYRPVRMRHVRHALAIGKLRDEPSGMHGEFKGKHVCVPQGVRLDRLEHGHRRRPDDAA